jgi:diadenosine tetraphosphate (Ap4A) HIT family hydrolase
MSAVAKPGCELCDVAGGDLIVRAPSWRVVRVADDAFPAFYRVIWNNHIAEFTDLSPDDRALCMAVVGTVETCLREMLRPTKINLATLGNVVPHLHWHVIARFDWDSHFPNPIWGASVRTVSPPPVDRLAIGLERLDAAVASRMR